MVKKKKVSEKKEIIHIKLESQEALKAKKDLLYSQIDLINLIKTIGRYKELREQELDKKMEISKKIKIIQKNIQKIKKEFPNLRPLEEKEKEKPLATPKMIIPKTSELEQELLDIQEKLRLMEN